ncbi:hypothetical protein J8273_3307 [Carpediemonas membranifera]|uniref:Phosphoribulokinase/uridine kinase domain-containing protein n=1 Tax=Carpediemonas membranifera TaxID=201153 RepID=A0A8J6ASS6_9EUKA|nr:hypothetical protein J8273_3307 [Carpediemonas membranifera]|eukprot:KAG9393178.1 hypothetical protein J8273_3307 [Carpediemonas membranifera]
MLVFIWGPTSSGKSTIAKELVSVANSCIIAQDDFYYTDDARFSLIGEYQNWDAQNVFNYAALDQYISESLEQFTLVVVEGMCFPAHTIHRPDVSVKLTAPLATLQKRRFARDSWIAANTGYWAVCAAPFVAEVDALVGPPGTVVVDATGSVDAVLGHVYRLMGPAMSASV